MRKQVKRAFTLIEILIVVVILGILAAIVIPQFTDASQEASRSSVSSQLQTLRGQIELYRVRNQGFNPDVATNGWGDMMSPPNGEPPYIQTLPRNPLFNGADQTSIGGAADGSTAWVWMSSVAYTGPGVAPMQLYAWDDSANPAALFDNDQDGNPD